MVSVSDLVTPYGGSLVDLVVPEAERAAVLARALRLPSVQLGMRALCDLELLATGAFSPLSGFMGPADYRRVVHEMRLADGVFFPMPLTLPVPDARALSKGGEIALRDARNQPLAVMTVAEVFERDPDEARLVAGSADSRHPLVAEMAHWPRTCASGPLRVLELPQHHDFTALRRTPRAVRSLLADRGHARVVAFQTRNPIHRAHEWLTRTAAEAVSGTLLIHPVVGMTKPGDLDHFTRVRCYQALCDRYYDASRTLLSLLPLAMRMAGPREALWHALIRRNFGASHFIVGRDHASPGVDSTGKPFYGPFDAQSLLAEHQQELGITPVPLGEVVYLPDEDRYEEVARVPAGRPTVSLSGTAVRDMLQKGEELPAWFTRPEIARILQEAHPPAGRRGFCVWLTGLSGAGKTTVADILTVLFMERGRPVTSLDGDVVRTHLSKGLGFSREDRDTNILRIAFVAAEVVRHHGVALVAAVSPYDAAREAARALVGADRFVLVHVATPLAVCEARDPKGLYAKARRGEAKGVTGIDDPYEEPAAPDVVLPTQDLTPEECARRVLEVLVARGLLAG
jgi:sulfate adenylyltransferase